MRILQDLNSPVVYSWWTCDEWMERVAEPQRLEQYPVVSWAAKLHKIQELASFESP